MRLVLNIQNSVVDVFNGYACTTSICIDKTDGRKWFVQNYLNYLTIYNENYDFSISDYFYSDYTYNCAINFFQPENIMNFPYITYSVPCSMVKDIVAFIRDRIIDGYYVCLFVNLRYIKQYNKNSDVIHDVFIYGFDDEKRLMYATGYVNGQKYSQINYTYEEIEKAYQSLNVDSPAHINFDTKRISFFKYRENFKYDFSVAKFINDLKEYLNIIESPSINTRRLCYGRDYSEDLVAYGNKGITVLKEYIKKCILSKKEYVDMRQVYFLLNHKINMKYKMEYLLEEGAIHDNSFVLEYDKIISLAKKGMNLMIKFYLTKDKTYLENLIEHLDRIYDKEKEVLNKLIKCLEKYI